MKTLVHTDKELIEATIKNIFLHLAKIAIHI